MSVEIERFEDGDYRLLTNRVETYSFKRLGAIVSSSGLLLYVGSLDYILTNPTWRKTCYIFDISGIMMGYLNYMKSNPGEVNQLFHAVRDCVTLVNNPDFKFKGKLQKIEDDYFIHTNSRDDIISESSKVIVQLNENNVPVRLLDQYDDSDHNIQIDISKWTQEEIDQVLYDPNFRILNRRSR